MPDPDDLWPPGITPDDIPALDELAAAGIMEGDFGEPHAVPADALFAYECLAAAAAGMSPDA